MKPPYAIVEGITILTGGDFIRFNNNRLKSYELNIDKEAYKEDDKDSIFNCDSVDSFKIETQNVTSEDVQALSNTVLNHKNIDGMWLSYSNGMIRQLAVPYCDERDCNNIGRLTFNANTKKDTLNIKQTNCKDCSFRWYSIA